MAQFEIIGEIDPFLRVRLRQGESCFCMRGCTVMLDKTLDLRAKIKGDVSKSVFRRIVNKSSFFFQDVEAVRGSGECLIAPQLPGSLRVLEIGETQYYIAAGSFLSGSGEARVAAKVQSIDKALFSHTGGMFILQTDGFGQIVISGFGSLYEIEMVPGHELIIHNSHIVAWQQTLDFSISFSTTEDGLISNAINAVMRGNAIVLRFSGYGKVIICSRNRDSLADWVRSKAMPNTMRRR